MTAETLLSRLEKVRQTRPGCWLARCPGPSHRRGDKHPSLVVTEKEDGRVLIFCRAGCETANILAAAGLEFADLYPERPVSEHGIKPERKPFPAADVLRAVAFEATVVECAASQIQRKGYLNDREFERLALAQERLQAAVRAAGVDHG